MRSHAKPDTCFVAGASGYLGSHFLGRYAAQLNLVPIVRRLKDQFPPGVSRPILMSDLDGFASTCATPDQGQRALIHFIGCSRETYHNEIYDSNVRTTATLLRAARALKVSRIVYVSGFGIGRESQSVYYRSKAAAEELIASQSVSSTILRPSYILGGADELTPWLLSASRAGGRLEIPGDGRYRIQPIHVDQFTEIVMNCAHDPSPGHQRIDVLGPIVSFRKFIEDYTRALGLVADVTPIDPGAYIRAAVVDPVPQFTLSQLGILFADLIGPPTRGVGGVRLYRYRPLLAALARSAS